MRVLRLLRTAAYLKPQQIYGRALHRLIRPQARLGNTPGRRLALHNWTTPAGHDPCMTGPASFCFLNTEGSVATLAQWNDPAREKLWLYNLHYFDDLNAKGARERAPWHRNLIARWIAENSPGHGNGWEPYPLSLRIVNWIKFALGEANFESSWCDSLAVQTRWLEQRIEWHLLGNHILANAKALVFAGLFFEGHEAERWLARGRDIFRRELPEQILADGGHFERSPMYHSIILEDLLDLLNLCRTFGVPADEIYTGLATRTEALRRWLAAMSLGDGRISFFNDAAFGIAAEPTALEEYAAQLGFAKPQTDLAPLTHLRESGYARLALDDAVVLCDVAPVGPAYVPGHAHADTLSFEFSLRGERVIVNGGTSVYETGAQRRFERSTRAHSTVEIDETDSSEVWSSFRVGRRARVREVSTSSKAGAVLLSASHDGYAHRRGHPIHRRAWQLEPRKLTITDVISGRPLKALARFHLGPGIEVMGVDGGDIRLPSGRIIAWQSSTSARIAASSWHPRFGVTVPTWQIAMDIPAGRLETTFVW